MTPERLEELRAIWKDDQTSVVNELLVEIDRLRSECKDIERCLNPLDAVVHHLGIAESFTDPVDAIKAIERQRDEALDSSKMLRERLDALKASGRKSIARTISGTRNGG